MILYPAKSCYPNGGNRICRTLSELYPTYFLAANAPGGFLHFYDTLYNPEKGDPSIFAAWRPRKWKIHFNASMRS